MTEPTQAELNRIELLKKCVKFYAEKENYSNKIQLGEDQRNEFTNQIALDNGTIARHTLEIMDTLEKSEADMIQQYSTMEQNLTPEDLIKQVREISEQFNKK
jgi:hypothetical protein